MPRIKVALGVAPEHADAFSPDLENDIREAAVDSKSLSAIGSCGLSESYDETQLDAFKRQIALAKDLNLALIVQADGALDDAFHVLQDAGFPKRNVLLQGFAGSQDDLKPWVDQGCYISFDARAANDPVAYCNMAKLVPENRILVESGAPNHPTDMLSGYDARPDQVVFVADALRGVCPPNQLFCNALDFFGL